jgi:hypothetical protein
MDMSELLRHLGFGANTQITTHNYKNIIIGGGESGKTPFACSDPMI